MLRQERLKVLEGILKDCFGEYDKNFKETIPALAKVIDKAYSVDKNTIFETIVNFISANKWGSSNKVIDASDCMDLVETLANSDDVLEVRG
ncbi:MAG: hypothetical protein DRR06_19900 [Gammaproteobacteria bacterium]|nr:MAG: hypothetical protein DRR06_19900 [Gammaproteobacteria bacterium]